MATVAEPSLAGGLSPSAAGWHDYSKLKVVSSRHPWRFVGSAFAVLGLSLVVQSLVTNPRWEWNVVAEYLTVDSVLRGLWTTVYLTVASATLGFLFGALIALARLSKSPVLSGAAWFYTWFFRSLPILVLLVIIYNWGYLYEYVGLGIPFTNISFVKVKTVTLLGPIATAIIGLTLNEAAYSAETIRGGILSVDQGQLEAAASLGISRSRRFLRIVLPQAMRAILPNAFNSLTGLVKGTSIVYVLAVYDIFHTIQVIYNRTQRVLPMLLVAVVWYVLLTTILSVLQYYVERIFSKGASRAAPKTPFQRLRSRLGSIADGIRQRTAARPAARIAALEGKGGDDACDD
jgi:polar amino acid transport system permease protein